MNEGLAIVILIVLVAISPSLAVFAFMVGGFLVAIILWGIVFIVGVTALMVIDTGRKWKSFLPSALAATPKKTRTEILSSSDESITGDGALMGRNPLGG